MDHDQVKLVHIGELVQKKGKPLVGCLLEQIALSFSGCNNPDVATAVLPSSPYIGCVLCTNSYCIFIWCTWPGFHPAFGLSKVDEDPVSQFLVGQTGEDQSVL